ncbi:FAD-binding oxidoreductase [Amycolatopsis sp. NPDC023774]|uniref:NAD(P)/FAD-dependent oxidoreductase n=1 Tax=Amycolatopsis sp. NPDC023774 TaxID=3155015 RepID=UPI0033D7E26A
MSDLVSDVVVVGAGMAGASVAAELASRVSVVLVEAEYSPAVHSTGRSAAAFLPSYGGAVVRALTAASRSLYDARSVEYGTELLRSRPLIWVATDPESLRALAHAAKADRELVQLTSAETVAWCPALRADRIIEGALDSAAMDIDVAGLHGTYLGEFKRRNGNLLLDAPVRHVERTGREWRVTAGTQVISCGQVVNAAGAWADEVAKLAGVPTLGLQPKVRSAFVSPTAFSGEISDWPMIFDILERWYFKPEATLILGSPADETDTAPGDARPDELAVARALESINDITTLGLRSVRRAWAGLRSFVADRAPVVGSWAGHEGFHFVAGQGGYGIQMAPALAAIAADAVLEGELSARTAAYGATLDALGPGRLGRA